MIDGVAQHAALGLGNANVILTTHASWATLLKTKPADYSVPGGVTIGANGETRLVGIPVVPHSQVTGSRFYVINTDAFAVAVASGLTVRSTETDQDDFINAAHGLNPHRQQHDEQIIALAPLENGRSARI
jgi:hypothetical protein